MFSQLYARELHSKITPWKKNLKCREYVSVALLQNKGFYALFQSSK